MTKQKFPWLKLGKKSAPELPERPPIWLGNRSNGEYFHQQTAAERKIHELTMQRADETARRLGMDRREFLASSMGMFTTLAVMNQVGGCSGSNGDGTMSMSPADMAAASGGSGTGAAGGGAGSMASGMPGGMAGSSAGAAGAMGAAGRSGTGAAGGGGGGTAGMPSMSGTAGSAGNGTPTGKTIECPYVVPTEATCEETALLKGDEFIFDIQTHSFDNGEWRMKNSTYANFLGLLATCGDAGNDRLNCFDEKHYGKYMFVESDTTVSVITSWPAQLCTADVNTACGLPLSNEGMRKLREHINMLAKSQRVVNQVQVMPNDRWELQRDVMTMAVQDPMWRAVSWKAYPAWGPAQSGIGGMGYFLNDMSGSRFVEHGLSLGIPNFAIHKGLPIPGFDVEHNQPIEIGEVAKRYPEANFIIYHSGIGAGTSSLVGLANVERHAYDEKATDPRMQQGCDQLITSLRQAGITADNNKNVFAELGSAWSNVMNDTQAAQHFIGKLLKYIGPNNVVWGTDCILYGSPQPQIEAFRRFQITTQFQQMYGYPELTPEIKAKIFGLNAARIFCIDPMAKRCEATNSTFAQVRRQWDVEFGERRWAFQQPVGPTTRREFLQLARMAIARRSPGA
ncbi:MAG TPA: amidohydrolase family protein [Polyangiales bacterium]|nr:amidohydrolase family protein [Polyangiales bacterium]